MEYSAEQRGLVLRAQRGDTQAIGDLIERHSPLGRRIAGKMVADAEAADIAQDAAVEVVRSIGRLRDPDRFSSWYYGIVLNLCRSYLRSRAKAHENSLDLLQGGTQFEAIDFASTEPDPADAAIEVEIRDMVLGAVRELPDSLRAPTLLHYFESLTLREIAAALGISVANVKVRLHRARGQLRALLSVPTPERALATSSASRPETHTPEAERIAAMARVRVFDVLHRVQPAEAGAEQQAQSVVMLVDEAMERALPIWTRRAEAVAIALAARNKATPRPMTASLMATLLRTGGVQVKEVRITRLEQTVYFAEVETISDGQFVSIDARPSDAIALALNSNAPIYVADDVMQRCSIEIPMDPEIGRREPQGIGEVIAEVERTFLPAGRRPITREAAEQATRELVREVFGVDAD
jgi:RNA polymerase sigma factor (sigma-70 family)